MTSTLKDINSSDDLTTTNTDENASGYKEDNDQGKENKLYRKDQHKNRLLAEELNRYKTLYERERRQRQQYARDMETEMEKRDQELEKKETDIFDLEEDRQRLLTKMELLKGELEDGRLQNQSLAAQLDTCQRQLQEERNKTLPIGATNETALFEAESKVEELRTTMEDMKKEVKRLFNANLQLDDRVHNLEAELSQCASEADSLRSLVKCQQEELKGSRAQYQEMQIQLHQLQTESSAGGAGIAPRGNSLFAEVVDGKERLEKQLALLHHRCHKLQLELGQMRKLAYENAMNRIGALDGQVLTGPTLAIFKVVKAELETKLNEKQSMLEKLHALEEAERREVVKLARENPLEFSIFQENIHSMTISEKQRLADRVFQLEMREQELLDAVCFEKQRASSVPQLEERLQQQQRMLAHYEKTQLIVDSSNESDSRTQSGGSGMQAIWTPLVSGGIEKNPK